MAGETLPDRKYPIIITTLVITILAAIFLVWRLIVRFRLNPKFGLSEYLMIAGVIMNTAANVVAILGAYNGEGRLDADPFLTPGRRMTAMHLIFAAQSLNVYAIFLVKLSICAYLMPLAFRRGFRAVIWMSVVIVVVCNFIIPTCSHLGECRPMAMMWNPAVKGTCWPLAVRQAGAYVQASANIVTDLVYAASPMVYLGEINLPRRTKLGIGIVFVLALLGTGLSVIKLWELHKVLNLKQDYLYGAVNLSIYSVIEVGITIIVACLPPLRKIFDKFLQKIMPDSIMARASKAIMSLPSFATITFSSSVPTRTDTTFAGDSENGEGGLAEGREKNLPQMVQVQTTWNTVSDEESHAGFGADRQQPRP